MERLSSWAIATGVDGSVVVRAPFDPSTEGIEQWRSWVDMFGDQVDAILGERLRFSAIPLFMLAGILLGPYEPFPSAIVEGAPLYLISELGIILLLFYLGLEFSLDRITQAWKLVARGGVIDLIINGGDHIMDGFACTAAQDNAQWDLYQKAVSDLVTVPVPRATSV
jgi:hypothetical protein